jgi:hypothetical protein
MRWLAIGRISTKPLMLGKVWPLRYLRQEEGKTPKERREKKIKFLSSRIL